MTTQVEKRPRVRPRVAVAGNPNSGKTTVFNALTGLRQKVGNYAGVTVEKREGTLTGGSATLLDLPGTYSLSARSPDEEVARDVLLGRLPGEGRPDGVLIVVDASNLERNLYFAAQVLDFGVPAIVCCNMMDIARRRGFTVDCDALARELGVPVIGAVASERHGVDAVRKAVDAGQFVKPPGRAWRLAEPVEAALGRIAGAMETSGAVPAYAVRGGAVLWAVDYLAGEAAGRQAAERFLKRIPADAAEVLRREAETIAEAQPDLGGAVVEARYAWIAGVMQRAVRAEAAAEAGADTLSDKIDRVVTHKIAGPIIFAGVMMVLFLSIFTWAEPLMNLLESGQNWLAEAVGSRMADGAMRSLVTDGVIGGVGSVLAFFPQICILFLCLGILEDSGYMARAAFLMDKLMSRVGLHGKSFIPLLSSYACAIPGIMATRTISDRRDRLATILVAPLMSCSARLPVYIILIAAVFGHNPWLKAGVMLGLYLLGTLTALGMALLFKRTLLAGPPSTFIMELPPYHLPRPWPILRAMWDRSKLFLTRAGTTIFAVCVLVWALSYYPRGSGVPDPAKMDADTRAAWERLNEAEAGLNQSRASNQNLDLQGAGTAPTTSPDLQGAGTVPTEIATNSTSQPAVGPDVGKLTLDDIGAARERIVAAEQLRHSYLGRFGRTIEPAIRPMGFDWRLGVGILSSFLAREVFVGTMGITYSVGGDADESSAELRDQLAAATWPDGRRVLTPAAGLSLMVFYVLACQCVSTLAVTRRETGSWRWPALMFAYMTVLACVASVVVFQVGRMLGG